MGFTFNGHHSDDFGIGVVTESIPLIVPKRQIKVPVQGRDGAYIFEGGYDNIEITLKCAIGGYDMQKRRAMARKISSWLTATGALVFDYEKDKQYVVSKTISDIPLSILGREHKDEFTIIFECEPFQFIDIGVIRDTQWNEAEEYWDDANYPWNGFQSTFSVSPGQTITVENVGTYRNLPVIKLTGTASNAIIGGFSYKNLAGTAYVDCKNMIVYSISGPNKINQIANFNGDFPELKPGYNQFLIGGTISNLTIDFDYNHPYL